MLRFVLADSTQSSKSQEVKRYLGILCTHQPKMFSIRSFALLAFVTSATISADDPAASSPNLRAVGRDLHAEDFELRRVGKILKPNKEGNPNCQRVPQPDPVVIWRCGEAISRRGLKEGETRGADNMTEPEEDRNSVTWMPGKVATPCSCGSKIYQPQPGQTVAIALEPGDYNNEADCNANCGRAADDACSICAEVQTHYGGGNVGIVKQCKHKSEFNSLPYGTTCFKNKDCWKQCINKAEALLEEVCLAPASF